MTTAFCRVIVLIMFCAAPGFTPALAEDTAPVTATVYAPAPAEGAELDPEDRGLESQNAQNMQMNNNAADNNNVMQPVSGPQGQPVQQKGNQDGANACKIMW